MFTFADYKKILDEVAGMNVAAKIIFTGGEPLLSPLTLPVARYAKTYGFDCRLMTNATLINEQNADELANLFETIKISVDGFDAARHDFYRGKAHVVPYSDIDLVIKQHVNNAGVLKCAMGDGEFSISHSGDVYLCQLLHHEDFKVGNVTEKSLTEIFKLICGGTCQALHFSETGSLDRAGDFCEYERLAIVDGIVAASDALELQAVP